MTQKTPLNLKTTTAEDFQRQGAFHLPRFRSHKIVRAGLIVDMTKPEEDGTVKLSLSIPPVFQKDIQGQISGFEVFVYKEYMEKHKPQKGGYYVMYDDGYESWSPAKAFEEGYKIASVHPDDARRIIEQALEAAENQIKWLQDDNSRMRNRLQMFDDMKAIITKVNPEQKNYAGEELTSGGPSIIQAKSMLNHL